MKQKLLVLTSTFPRWKGDKEPPFVYELSKRLTKWYDVHIHAPHAPGAQYKENISGITIRRFCYFPAQWELLAYDGGILSNLKNHPWRYALVPFFIVFQLISLTRLMRSREFDVIHAHWLIPQGILAITAKLITGSSSPILCTSHGGDMYALKGRLFNILKKFVLTRVDALTVVSNAMLGKACSLGADAKKTKVIPMGVDLTHQFVTSDIARTGKQLLFVGRLVEKKGLIYLIKAMSSIISSHPDARLTIVGSGPDEVMLKELVNDLGLNNAVTFLGAVENKQLPSLYQAADIVVFPSVVASDGDQEGFGLVQVEALGCGCAVVTTDLPAIRDIITDGKTGIVVAQKNTNELADKVNILLEHSRLRSSLAKKGRHFVLVHYDWDVIADKYHNTFKDMLQHEVSIHSSNNS